MSELQPIGGLQSIGGDVPQPSAPETPVPDTTIPALRPTPPAQAYPRRENPDQVPIYLYVIGGVLAVGLVVGITIPFLPSAPVAAPTGYDTFYAADKSFSCDLPQKWQVEAMGKASKDKGASIGDGVTAKVSDASVEVTESSIKGLLTAQLLYGSGPVPDGVFGSRAAPIFKSQGKKFKLKYRNYKETRIEVSPDMYPPMTGVVQNDKTGELIPDIRWSEFTADSNKWGLGGKRHGYRMAVGGVTNIMLVICECSERDWAKLKPSFEHTMVTLTEPRPKLDPNSIAVPGGAALPMGGDVPGFGGSGLIPSGKQ